MTDSNVTKSREENQVPAKENSRTNEVPKGNLKVAEVNMEAEKMSSEVATGAKEVTSSEKVAEIKTELVNENQSEKITTSGEMVEITKELAEKIQKATTERNDFLGEEDDGLPGEKKKTQSEAEKNTNYIKKISRYTIERVGLISPDELEAHGIIRRARVSGYICPLCNSGGGPNGTGMEYNKTVTDHTSFTCFSGSHAFNVLKLCAIHYHMETRKDYPKLLVKICEEFNIPIEYEEFEVTNSRRSDAKQQRKIHHTDPIDPEELKYIQEDLNSSLTPLENFLRYQPKGKWRGFDFEFLKAHGCRLINDWISPKNRCDKKKAVPSTRMIIPANETSYLSRLALPLSEIEPSIRPYVQEKMHAGRKALFNADILNSNHDEPIFVFEGFIDAMSAEMVGFKAIALGGRGEGKLLTEVIDELKDKPQLIILFDPDKAGRDSAPELREDLLNIKCPCTARFLSRYNCDLDANEILVKQGPDVLRAMLQGIINDSLSELNIIETELNRKDDAGLTTEDWDFIFSGNQSDLAYSRRLERFGGSRVRWMTDQSCWLLYKKGVWEIATNKTECLYPLAAELAEAMAQNAEGKREREIATKFQSIKKINAAISLLKSRPSILITNKELDPHNHLLNVLNGTIDLQTGELLPASPEHMITRQAPVTYRPGYHSPVVDNFLESTVPDENTRNALLRYLGYAATGEVCEERALFLYGPGGNGKGTLTRTLITLFGDYATTLRTSAILETNRSKDANAATTELNPLENCRLAIVEELPQSGQLDIAKFKSLTGSDFIPIRKLHQEQIRIKPHFSPILSGNYRPEIGDTRDPGITRRLMNIDFKQSFIGENRDPRLKRKLEEPDALSGFLTLIVEGAKKWYANGLSESEEMLESTREFINENDFIGDFIEGFCTKEASLSVTRKQLLATLKQEYADECLKMFGNRERAIVDAFKRIAGITYRRGSGGIYRFFGIGLKK